MNAFSTHELSGPGEQLSVVRSAPSGTDRGSAHDCADISVVIPSFDRTDLAIETLESVLGQTRAVREVIIVANGNDDHAAFWRERAGGRVRVVRERTAGPQTARNTGIQAATSTWVATL